MMAPTETQRPRQGVFEPAYEESLAEDLGEEWRLPITHRPTENLDRDRLEVASEDTQIASSNVGYKLLVKMGWKGQGLGKMEQGMIEPIKAGARDAKLGVGKQEQDDFYTAEENIERKKLNVEAETEREQKIRQEVADIRKVFYCELCNKQYKLATEFEIHLSSYDHNHKKRFKDMRENQAAKTRDDRQRREQRRAEKEMERLTRTVEAHRMQQQDMLQRQQQNRQGGQDDVRLTKMENPSGLGSSTSGNGAGERGGEGGAAGGIVREGGGLKGSLKFGIGPKGGMGRGTKGALGSQSKRLRVGAKVAAAFSNANSDDDQ